MGKWGDKPGVVRNLISGRLSKETILGKKSFWPGTVLLCEGIISEEKRGEDHDRANGGRDCLKSYPPQQERRQ